MKVFENGEAEDFFKCCITFKDLIREKPLETPEARFAMAGSLLRGQAKEIWNFLEVVEENKTNATFTSVQEKMKRHYLPPRAYRRQKHYMRKYLKSKQVSVKDFVTRLRELNKYLHYFPKDYNEQPWPADRTFPKDELADILVDSMPVFWESQMDAADVDPFQKVWRIFNFILKNLSVRSS
ncbi:MAG: hypothetical protein ACREOZ_05030 [Gloeomargaritales cyanobacterium]